MARAQHLAAAMAERLRETLTADDLSHPHLVLIACGLLLSSIFSAMKFSRAEAGDALAVMKHNILANLFPPEH